MRTLVSPYHLIHAFIDKTTMYMLVLYMLSALAAFSLLFGALGLVAFSVGSQLLSLVVVVTAAFASSVLLALITKVPANHHSSVITGLIIFFLITPGSTVTEYVILAGTIAFAIATKYIFVYRKQHIFNAAALAVFLLSLSGLGAAAWWVATPWLFIPLVITGLAVVVKIRRLAMVGSFLLVGFLVFMLEGLYYGDDVVVGTTTFFLSYPALFLGFFMLTEPFTMPPTRTSQMWYGALVGLLSTTSIFKPLVTLSPELALLIGNLAVYPLTLKRKLYLEVMAVETIAHNIYEIIFKKPDGMKFEAGQYLEWMVPHTKADTRGVRRYFTIASSPTEDVVRVALKIPEVSSTYKTQLRALKAGDVVIASQLAGDFILPKDTNQKIGLIAGGIGVTPFRSQLQHINDKDEVRDVVLFYGNNTIAEIAYGELFAKLGSKIGLKTVHVLAKESASSDYETGYFSADIVKRHLSDYAERVWYISGPPPMVRSAESVLRSLGVLRKNIKKDFFPGLA
ncbi:hypothetical protein K2P47_01220 [Patescibacteria group bacterium]|nr:hypothetical protein [Patescibacteria group bacterium]